jgi:MSHA pilin protein MshD
MCPRRRSHGVSLIEVVILIVVVAIGFMALFVLQSNTVQSTVDPVVRKQALAIASSLMEEIQLRGFTFCDPDDANVYTATSATVGGSGCLATVEAMGPEAGESRQKFDNVNDYNGLAMTGIRDITGNTVSGLEQYSASVAVTDAAATFSLPEADAALLITVTVTGPANVAVTLHGYRLRYAPNSP